MDFPKEQIVNSIPETILLASKISVLLREGDIIVVNGNLGSGKTTLIKSICMNYGITNANSPSFSLVNEYYGDKKVYHFDFYRLIKIEELYDIGFEDYLNDEEGIIFIEWGNLMEDIIPNNHIEIRIEDLGQERRQIKILRNK